VPQAKNDIGKSITQPHGTSKCRDHLQNTEFAPVIKWKTKGSDVKRTRSIRRVAPLTNKTVRLDEDAFV